MVRERRGRRGTIIPSLDPITRRRGRFTRPTPAGKKTPRPISRVSARPVFAQAFPIRAGARGRRPVREARAGQLGRITSVRRAKPLQRLGGDFDVLQPFGRPRPTRVEVAQPSGREGRLITVSSRTRLTRKESVRRRDRRPDTFRTGARGKKIKVKKGKPRRVERITPPRRRELGFDFIPFQEISFGEGRRRPQTTPFTTFGGRTATVGARGARGRPIRRREEEEEERPRRTRAPPPRRRRRSDDFGLGNIFDIQF